MQQAKNQQKGTTIVPFSFFTMATDNNIQLIEQFLQNMMAEEPMYFLVSVKIKPTNNIKVFLDGDNGLPIEKCVYFNRKLYKFLEEAGIYPEGEFSLEVSSPGIDEPLQLIRQYQKNIGRTIQVVFTDDTIKEGVLETVAEADIMIQCTSGKGKKAVTEQVVIPFSNIKSTTVQIKF
ncbi:ribosome maturation factor [Sediminibacterium sp.]|uniref:ribosome maturation factor n=1 Tax=Sediminibacterium sp. TaxID=1917865 RepID=UPI002719C7D0|nr:ribosome maturation factor [Sediminibacterium sp.]MDO8996758.1 ribosome maturation factor [Sediminibacterium sp.]MDP2420566.1 ribosome maturation factor [Sediminibacterium sp.]